MLFKDISYDELWGPFVPMNLFRGPLGDATYQISKL